jgi:hypothetical protein
MNLQSLIGLAEFRSNNYRKFYKWGFAMNGQTSRLEATRQIIYALNIERIVETGTHRATTAEWFSQFGLPVETVEINDRFFAFSQARLARFPNTKVIQKSSVSFLKERVAANRVPKDAAQLFYLDAHGSNYLPLQDELELIFSNYSNSVVLIDDFMVVDDAGYGYDSYAPGEAIDLDYISKCALPPVSVFYPSTPSSQETGRRRGWVVLSTNQLFRQKLEQVSLLRSYHYTPNKYAVSNLNTQPVG